MEEPCELKKFPAGYPGLMMFIRQMLGLPSESEFSMVEEKVINTAIRFCESGKKELFYLHIPSRNCEIKYYYANLCLSVLLAYELADAAVKSWPSNEFDPYPVDTNATGHEMHSSDYAFAVGRPFGRINRPIIFLARAVYHLGRETGIRGPINISSVSGSHITIYGCPEHVFYRSPPYTESLNEAIMRCKGRMAVFFLRNKRMTDGFVNDIHSAFAGPLFVLDTYTDRIQQGRDDYSCRNASDFILLHRSMLFARRPDKTLPASMILRPDNYAFRIPGVDNEFSDSGKYIMDEIQAAESFAEMIRIWLHRNKYTYMDILPLCLMAFIPDDRNEKRKMAIASFIKSAEFYLEKRSEEITNCNQQINPAITPDVEKIIRDFIAKTKLDRYDVAVVDSRTYQHLINKEYIPASNSPFRRYTDLAAGMDPLPCGGRYFFINPRRLIHFTVVVKEQPEKYQMVIAGTGAWQLRKSFLKLFDHESEWSLYKMYAQLFGEEYAVELKKRLEEEIDKELGDPPRPSLMEKLVEEFPEEPEFYTEEDDDYSSLEDTYDDGTRVACEKLNDLKRQYRTESSWLFMISNSGTGKETITPVKMSVYDREMDAWKNFRPTRREDIIRFLGKHEHDTENKFWKHLSDQLTQDDIAVENTYKHLRDKGLSVSISTFESWLGGAREMIRARKDLDILCKFIGYSEKDAGNTWKVMQNAKNETRTYNRDVIRKFLKDCNNSNDYLSYYIDYTEGGENE